ncbi:hypothetical protein [Planosporangium mesophilum]|nr:hypothetical protein [Planosporangium mesophilum]NJC83275.1 hypothetical protein [Planosporangium mesophilum]
MSRRAIDVRPVGSLVGGFLLSSFAVFALATGVGRAVGAPLIPETGRAVAVALIGVVLCAYDIAALRGGKLCRLSWRRQTPKNWIYRYGSRRGPFLWGLDTGLAVTTFRVSAATWALLALCAGQFAPWWVGLAFGGGFAAAQVGAIVVPRWRPARPDGTAQEPTWIVRALMRGRPVGQLASLAVLVAAVASVAVLAASGPSLP